MKNRRFIQDIHYEPNPERKRYTYTVSRPVSPGIYQVSKKGISKKNRISIKRASILLILILTVGVALRNVILPDSKAESEAKKVVAATQRPIAKPDIAALENQINAVINRYPQLQISVAYRDLKTSTTLNAGVQDPYIAASTPKLLTAILYLKQVEDGIHALNENIGGSPAKTQLRLLIEESDNTAWVNFNSLLGHAALESYAKDIGLQNYNSDRNLTTASDISILLQKLYGNKLLNQQHTRLLLSFMQKASEGQFIPAAVPADVNVYHKAGYLEDRAHDAAIIDFHERPFVLVIFTKSSGQYDFELGKQIMRDITSAVLSTAYPSDRKVIN